MFDLVLSSLWSILALVRSAGEGPENINARLLDSVIYKYTKLFRNCDIIFCYCVLVCFAAYGECLFINHYIYFDLYFD